MTLQQGKIYKYREDLYHVVSLHEFAGETWAVCERIGQWHKTFVDALRVTVDGAVEVDASEWTDALRRAEAERRALAKKTLAKADGERFGIRVVVWRSGGDGLRLIVRATSTMYVDTNGSKYKRSNGEQVGVHYGRGPTITAESLALLAEFCGDRAKVDIVAERRKAAEHSERDGGGS